MNALEALALARTTGCKVKSKNGFELFFVSDGTLMRLHENGKYPKYADQVWVNDIINPDGTPVLWEVVEEGATE